MRVYLTFDVEIWCGGWDNLDERFPAAFRRYIYGADEVDGYALPMTLRILREHGLKAVFFVEPLFAARFGVDRLRSILGLILEAGQEVQLHLHPEWCDEAGILSSARTRGKRPFLWQYGPAEQAALIRSGTELLRAAGGPPMRAFRAGSFAANADTWRALADEGYAFDSSMNATSGVSFPRDPGNPERYLRSPIEGLGMQSFPIGVFRTAFGRPRHAQIGACAYEELAAVIEGAARSGWTDYVLLSHGFEMLKAGSIDEDLIVVRRFRRLCGYLRNCRDRGIVDVVGFGGREGDGSVWATSPGIPIAPVRATLKRYVEQSIRRVR